MPRIDRDNPYNELARMLPQAAAEELAADLLAAELPELANLLAACRSCPGDMIPFPCSTGQTIHCQAWQLSEAVRHVVSVRIRQARLAAQETAARARLAGPSRRFDRMVRRNGDARRSSIVVLS